MKALDQQLEMWSERLQSDVKVRPDDVSKIATNIAKDVRWLNAEQKNEIRTSSPVELSCRYEELLAFQSWMEIANSK